jgi:hypothetical protein
LKQLEVVSNLPGLWRSQTRAVRTTPADARELLKLKVRLI